jgi:hypothetical protein
MTALESKIHLQSRAKCCNDARAIAKFAWICYDKVCSSGLSGRATTKVRYGFHDLVKRAKKKAVAAMAQTFPAQSKADTAKVITELGEGKVPGRQRQPGKAIMAKSPVKGKYDTLRGEVKKVVTR